MREVSTVQRAPGGQQVNEAQRPPRTRKSTLAIRFCQFFLLAFGIGLAFFGSQTHLDQTQIPGFLVALAVSWWLTPEIRARAVRLKLLDKPGEERRIHKVAVPRLGGVAIYISIMVAYVLMMAICGRFPRQGGLLGIAAGGTLIFVMGLLDDLESLPAKVKLGIQVLAACAAYSLGVRMNEYVPLPGGVSWDFLNSLQFMGIDVDTKGILHIHQWTMPITIMWLVGIANAVNLIDGMDGLAAGVSLISAITIWSVAMAPQLHQPYAAWIAAVLAGALLGFLRWNFNPARIFLGDSGAYLAGFILGSVAITGVMKTTTAVTVLLPMLILLFPLLDTSWAIIRRMSRGKSIFAPDAEHIHHKLLNKFGNQKKVAYLIYAFCGLLGLAANWMVGQQNYYLSVCAAVLILSLFFAEILNRHRRMTRNKQNVNPTLIDDPDEAQDFTPEPEPEIVSLKKSQAMPLERPEDKH